MLQLSKQINIMQLSICYEGHHYIGKYISSNYAFPCDSCNWFQKYVWLKLIMYYCTHDVLSLNYYGLTSYIVYPELEMM